VHRERIPQMLSLKANSLSVAAPATCLNLRS
jgi:hypothetical protein